ncbi:MAG TPA: ribonuclease HI [Syntrophales bacterium]|nr:ribonuclease HI [Syntrophales bacterium]
MIDRGEGDLAGNPKKFYAVARGKKPGIYTAWFGPTGAEVQIRGYAGAHYKGFAARDAAEQWLRDQTIAFPDSAAKASNTLKETIETHIPSSRQIRMYTDGGCRRNPGPGGYCAIIDDGNERNELFRGYRLTTNNRMELMACIAGLESLKKASKVILHSDSRYVVDGMTKGWAQRWRSRNWMRTKTEAAENADLWSRLLELCDHHRVTFVWVRGHAGHPENERCDQLAACAADGKDLTEDRPYIEGRTKLSPDLLG